jgi:hypothetical protein
VRTGSFEESGILRGRRVLTATRHDKPNERKLPEVWIAVGSSWKETPVGQVY